MIATVGARLSLSLLVAALAVPARAAVVKPICFPEPAGAGPGVADPFKPPEARATALNAEGKTFYRQNKWDEARGQYRAAAAADPDFWAPTLNIACSYVRQERFAEATTEVLKLLQGPYVPWAREILEAADLGALKVRPEMATVREAMAQGARRWGAGLPDDLLFVARMRPALRIPPPVSPNPAGVFILGPQQEIFAWSPASGRYRQLTAEDGRVLIMVIATDRRRVVYATGEKLIRGADGKEALRGLSLHMLDLPAMSPGPAIPIAGDVTRLELTTAGRGFVARVEGDKTDGWFSVEPHLDQLVRRPPPPTPSPAADRVVLTPRGVTGKRQQRMSTPCALVARERDKAGEGGATAIEIAPVGKKPFLLKPRLGAGLGGLFSP